jgi:hypothetical protein
MGMRVAASTPAGTSMNPVAFCPGAALVVPTAKLFCWARAGEAAIEAVIISDAARNAILLRRGICVASVELRAG